MDNPWSKKGKQARLNYLSAANALYNPSNSLPTPTSEEIATVMAPKLKTRRKRQRRESQGQIALVTWLRLKQVFFFSIPNEGSRSMIECANLKRQGLMPGASDLFILEPHPCYRGYFIELKAPGKRPTPAQLTFIVTVRNKGYQADWFDDWEKAKIAIELYLQHP